MSAARHPKNIDTELQSLTKWIRHYKASLSYAVPTKWTRHPKNIDTELQKAATLNYNASASRTPQNTTTLNYKCSYSLSSVLISKHRAQPLLALLQSHVLSFCILLDLILGDLANSKVL